ncbi:hypothetical protein MXD81_52505 [Microbacteriaceae bacterium K1510]|nr:hypothetical protein [Microbacteriaceae bacterium K1510]
MPDIERLQALCTIKSNLLRLKCLVAAVRLERTMYRHARTLKYGYNPNRPRVPAGDPTGGQWTGVGARSSGDPREDTGQRTRVAQVQFGRLVAEIPISGGRNCVYNFGSFSVVVPGPARMRCPATSPLAGTTHGRLLNDN